MRRLANIFKSDGKTVIVAMDHGMGLSVNPALDNTGEILEAIVAGGADAILTTYGIATRYEDILKNIGLILRMDGGGSQLGKSGSNQILYTVEDALRIGADAMACMGFPGSPWEFESMSNVAQLAAEGHAMGLPLIAEMLPGGFDPSVPNTIENVTLTTRTGCEYGADVIKTTFVGSVEDYRKVIAASYRPVIVLGGEKTPNLQALFEVLSDAMTAGASGVAIGRNVWKNPDPEKVTAALVDIVHNGRKPSELKGF